LKLKKNRDYHKIRWNCHIPKHLNSRAPFEVYWKKLNSFSFIIIALKNLSFMRLSGIIRDVRIPSPFPKERNA